MELYIKVVFWVNVATFLINVLCAMVVERKEAMPKLAMAVFALAWAVWGGIVLWIK